MAPGSSTLENNDPAPTPTPCVLFMTYKKNISTILIYSPLRRENFKARETPIVGLFGIGGFKSNNVCPEVFIPIMIWDRDSVRF